MSRVKLVFVWIVTAVLGMVFLMVGSTKTFQPGMIAEQFAGWGYPAWFVPVIGVAELLGALLLLIPRTARYGAGLLVLVMAGAAFTHIRAGEWPNLAVNALFAAGLLWVGRARSGGPSVPPESAP